MKVDVSYEAMRNIYRKLGTDGLHEQEVLNDIAMEINDYTSYLKDRILKQFVQN